MELIHILRTLRRQWVWVLAGFFVAAAVTIAAAYSVTFFPPALHGEEKFEYGAGSAQILIDSSNSTLGALDKGFEPLSARASVYSRLITSPVLLRHIGAAAGIPAEQIYAQGPFNIGQARAEREPTAERRASELFKEGIRYRLRFEAESGLPVLSAFAIAPTAKEAVNLANGAAEGLQNYIESLQERDEIPNAERVLVNQMGPAEGGIVNEGADTKINLLMAIGIFLLWCFAVVFITNAVAEARRADERVAAGPTANGNGRRDLEPEELSPIGTDSTAGP